MRLLSICVGGTLAFVLTTVGAVAQERLQRARQECWASFGYPNGPGRGDNNMNRISDQVSACVRGKMAGGPPADGRGQGQGRPQR